MEFPQEQPQGRILDFCPLEPHTERTPTMAGFDLRVAEQRLALFRALEYTSNELTFAAPGKPWPVPAALMKPRQLVRLHAFPGIPRLDVAQTYLSLSEFAAGISLALPVAKDH